MHTRRQAFVLAGALTATAFTAVAAIAGMSHRPAALPQAARTPVVQVAPHQAPTPRWTDD